MIVIVKHFCSLWAARHTVVVSRLMFYRDSSSFFFRLLIS